MAVKKTGILFQHFEIGKKDKNSIRILLKFIIQPGPFSRRISPRLDPEVLEATFRKAKPIIDEELIWFAYYQR